MVQILPGLTFVARNCSAKQEIIPKKTNDWKNSHPAAGNNHAYYADVKQFSY